MNGKTERERCRLGHMQEMVSYSGWNDICAEKNNFFLNCSSLQHTIFIQEKRKKKKHRDKLRTERNRNNRWMEKGYVCENSGISLNLFWTRFKNENANFFWNFSRWLGMTGKDLGSLCDTVGQKVKKKREECADLVEKRCFDGAILEKQTCDKTESIPEWCILRQVFLARLFEPVTSFMSFACWKKR